MSHDLREGLDPLIINLAPTGMVPTRQMSMHVPLQPREIFRDVLACADIGITIAHLHARDVSGQPTHRKDVYAELLGMIRSARPDIVLCVSCSGRGDLSFDERAEVLDLPDGISPDMASLTLSSLNFPDGASVNDPKMVVALAERMQARGITPELEVFDLGMANMLRVLIRRGLVKPPYVVNLLLGNVATAQARIPEIAALITALPEGSLHTLAGLGSAQLPIAAVAVGAADGVRIGLEDNLWLDSERQNHATNVGLVKRVHEIASAVGRPIMKGPELRGLLAGSKR
jgi:3-keto-5-aminohexanoate cleavage enzyme